MRRTFAGTILSAAFFLILSSFTASLFAQDTLPELWGVRVHDDAKVLSPQVIDRLEHQLKTFEDSTTNQVAILVIPTLNGQTIEEYSVAVATKWKLGTKKNDNGVLVVVATNDHAMRIEVGMGLQGTLTDAVSSQIIRNKMAPSFRKGDYDTGISDAVDAIIAATKNEYKIEEAGSGEWSLTGKIFGGIIIFGILGLFTRACLRSVGCAGWFGYVFLIPAYFLLPFQVIGATADLILTAIFIIATPIAKIIIGRSDWAKKQRRAKKIFFRRSSSSGGSYSSSSWSDSSSSSDSSWSSSSSSFSGGGGSFDGGGSSGSW